MGGPPSAFGPVSARSAVAFKVRPAVRPWNFLRATRCGVTERRLLPQAHLIHIEPLSVCDLRLGFYDADEGDGGDREERHVRPAVRAERAMRRLVPIAAASIALGAAGFALAGGVAVTLGPSGPQPKVVTVSWGDTLSFANGDSVTHAITSPRDDLRSAGDPARRLVLERGHGAHRHLPVQADRAARASRASWSSARAARSASRRSRSRSCTAARSRSQASRASPRRRC